MAPRTSSRTTAPRLLETRSIATFGGNLPRTVVYSFVGTYHFRRHLIRHVPSQGNGQTRRTHFACSALDA